MAKIVKNNGDGESNIWRFDCPGCGFSHRIAIKENNAVPSDPFWYWNGSVDAPTFKPSVLVHGSRTLNKTPLICHSWITDGKIQFLQDCTHALKGKTVELPEIN